jgi:HSP20 family protein
VGGTPRTLEIYAFAPGIEPDSLQVTLEQGMLSVSGERKRRLPERDAKTAIHINERFEGRFHRVLTLPDDADPEGVAARYRDGVLHITVQRRASAQPRRITIQ